MTADAVTGRSTAASFFRRVQHWLSRGASDQQTALLDALPSHVAVLDGRGVIVSVNEAWRRFEAAEPICAGRSYFEICSGAPRSDSSDAHCVAEGVRSVLAGTAKSFSMDYVCDSAAEKQWFTLSVTPLTNGGKDGAIVMRRDTTAARIIEETLRASELRFRQMAENIRDVCFLIDAVSHHVLYISPAYESICGRSCESFYANRAPWSAGIHPDDRARVQQKYETGVLAGKFEYECRILRPDGSVRWIGVMGATVHDAEGLLVRVAGTIEDITQRKHSPQALHDSRERLNKLSSGGRVCNCDGGRALTHRSKQPRCREHVRVYKRGVAGAAA